MFLKIFVNDILWLKNWLILIAKNIIINLRIGNKSLKQKTLKDFDINFREKKMKANQNRFCIFIKVFLIDSLITYI